MRLERLEISGFKSFSDRSELAFDKGVTAIVGPNGCGKSNVADAITWVMGEQSAKSLRGERMEDVIFSGSDARKPTATAEVRLRFTGVLKTVSGPAFLPHQVGNGHANGHQNGHANGHGTNGHDGNGHAQSAEAAVASPLVDADELIQQIAREVEVTRRLYRSGESEYLIDGHTCRLRDVHDLLMDTGLGAKAYAIIEQGKIGMILSSRPTDRRQLIEEAAGVTKYKARRRAAELKLEAAQQNLTRVDDIVFEVEKQRGTLKRQAAKARRYQKLRDELRRWEKVLFARRYRQLAETIESVRGRLFESRERETLAGARVSEVESDLARLRIEMVEAEARATAAREAAHACELGINRQQQQVVFDQEQVTSLDARAAAVAAELTGMAARREPARAALASRREAASLADAERTRAAEQLMAENDSYESAHREIEGLESDVEAARSEVFSALNSATALRHAVEHAGAARDRVAGALAKLAVEADDVHIEAERVERERAAAADGLERAQATMARVTDTRTGREADLASARAEYEWRSKLMRAEEHALAGLEARLTSLEELQAARAGYGDAPRAVLAEANGKVNQQGAIADYLDVEAGCERAVEAYLGDLLQHVVVERPEHAAAGFEVVRAAGAGRCGFLIASAPVQTSLAWASDAPVPPGLVALSSAVRVSGPFAEPIRRTLGDAWIADSYDRAAAASHEVHVPVVTRDGVVFRGPHLVTGGSREDARGILETKREIKEIRERIEEERAGLARLAEETARFEVTASSLIEAIAGLTAEAHAEEKAIVAFEAQLQRAVAEAARLSLKGEQLARERRQAEDERDTIDRRQEEAQSSIVQLQVEQQAADERLTLAQRRLFEAREATEDLGRRAAEARAAHAAMAERAIALASDIERMEEAVAELDARTASLTTEGETTSRRISELRAAIVDGQARLDADVRTLDGLRGDVQGADGRMSELRLRTDDHEMSLKVARAALESVRAAVSDLDIARATAESDLAHLESSCLETVQDSMARVLADVEELERTGNATPDARVIEADEPDDAGDSGGDPEGTFPAHASDEAHASPQSAGDPDALVFAEQRTLGAEDAIVRLRAKIDRLGPVNMMAIEQFDELESRHAFLTAERKDLMDSIAQTGEAIARIDETTHQRFIEAFAAINRNFQEMFGTLFGGGRAGLTLLDEQDPLGSGIEIIAQPPGKRLQSVQLLSGGEKALTAIALMFGMFKYKPSPFCLLDEIDAPLDDANIGRFVEMLRSMQEHTQFIVITHNRKTMEIADRLYGVTMEEPGVSKLISVQLN